MRETVRLRLPIIARDLRLKAKRALTSKIKNWPTLRYVSCGMMRRVHMVGVSAVPSSHRHRLPCCFLQYSETDESESESSDDAFELENMANDQALLTESERQAKKREELARLAQVRPRKCGTLASCPPAV
jgi:hypothetical protein